MTIVSMTTSSLPLFPILRWLCFFICICHKLFSKFIPLSILLFNYIIPVAYNHLTWAWDFLLHCSLFPNSHDYMINVPENNGDHLGLYEPEPESKEVVAECAVCLCKIEEGEEIREVRCGHMFHRECLDRWVIGHDRNNNNGTCPLCRVSIDPPRIMVNEGGEEVIIFNFSSVSWSSSTDNRSMWWLR